MNDRGLLRAIESLKLIKGAHYEYYRLDWDKVVEIIQETIPQKNIERIKNTSKASILQEFKSLVEFLFDKMPSYEAINRRKIDYLCWWKTVSESTSIPSRPKAVSTQTKIAPKVVPPPRVDPKTANPVPATNKKEFPGWGWWLIGGIVSLVFLGMIFPVIFDVLGVILAIGLVLGAIGLIFAGIPYLIEKMNKKHLADVYGSQL